MPKPYDIALISSMNFEAANVLAAFSRRQKVSNTIISGTLLGKRAVHISCGVGIANAAHGVSVLMERYTPSMVIMFGLAGAYPASGLKIADVAAASNEVYADTGVLMPEGPEDMEFIDIPLITDGERKLYNNFPLDRDLLQTARALVNKTGTFLTLSTATGTLRRSKELERTHKAICENMEGAAVAHICTLYKVPMLEIRGISNIVEKRDLAKWDKNAAAQASGEAVLDFIKKL